MNLQTEIDQLFSTQQRDWAKLNEGVLLLDTIQEKEFTWSDVFQVKLQYNPGRIVSTSAVINKETIDKRPCFLCEANRPEQQQGIPFLDKYIILCNPFPILQNHLTIPLYSHVPQRLRKKVCDMLTLAAQLPDYVVFYNGPKCGASAPDHFHLQAGLKTPYLLQGDNAIRSCLQIESDSQSEVENLFEDVYLYLSQLQPNEEEPMINVIAFTENNKYKLHIFPRKAHRSSHYSESGDKQLLISPGALDVAGMMICVREEDFTKISKQDLEDIYSQVSLHII